MPEREDFAGIRALDAVHPVIEKVFRNTGDRNLVRAIMSPQNRAKRWVRGYTLKPRHRKPWKGTLDPVMRQLPRTMGVTIEANPPARSGEPSRPLPPRMTKGETATLSMPNLDRYRKSGGATADVNYYLDLLHELAHITGRKEYLDRVSLTLSGHGREYYAREEATVELAACLAGVKLGIGGFAIGNSANYIQRFLRHIGDDPKHLRSVLVEARKAANLLVKLHARAARDLRNKR